jgi:hypothetical protein
VAARATLAVAVRTVADASGDHAWGIMTIDRGGHMAKYETVADWPDIGGPWRQGLPPKGRQNFAPKASEES